MTESPIGAKAFEIACEAYSKSGGTGKAALDKSVNKQLSGKRFTILRNAAGKDLASYRADAPDLAEPEWPEPYYLLGPREHIYALGVISANFTLLEKSLGLLFLVYTNLPRQTGNNLFAKINNELRINIIRDALAEAKHPTEVSERVEHFLSGYMTIFNSRNTLMHASPASREMYATGDDPLGIPITLEKVTAKGQARSLIYELSLGQLRSIADSAHMLREYGANLYRYIMWHYERAQLERIILDLPKEDRQIARKIIEDQTYALPDKPPQPLPLTPRTPENPTAPPRRP